MLYLMVLIVCAYLVTIPFMLEDVIHVPLVLIGMGLSAIKVTINVHRVMYGINIRINVCISTIAQLINIGMDLHVDV